MFHCVNTSIWVQSFIILLCFKTTQSAESWETGIRCLSGHGRPLIFWNLFFLKMAEPRFLLFLSSSGANGWLKPPVLPCCERMTVHWVKSQIACHRRDGQLVLSLFCFLNYESVITYIGDLENPCPKILENIPKAFSKSSAAFGN